MSKFGKVLLSSAAFVGTAATAYYVYKNKDRIFKRAKGEQVDDTIESTEENLKSCKTHYVSLNEDAPADEVVENITNSVTETASHAFEAVKNTVDNVIGKVKDAVETFTTTSDEIGSEDVVTEESVEEFFDDEN